jgi:hypothetical protein
MNPSDPAGVRNDHLGVPDVSATRRRALRPTTLTVLAIAGAALWLTLLEVTAFSSVVVSLGLIGILALPAGR